MIDDETFVEENRWFGGGGCIVEPVMLKRGTTGWPDT